MWPIEAKFWRCGLPLQWETPAEKPPLTSERAHVWLCHLAKAQLYLAHNTPAENRRAKQMIPADKANEFLLSRAWLRCILSAYTDNAEPQAIRIGITETGKPFATDYPSLHFNLSHSGEFVAIALSHRPVGIDMEKLRAVPDWQALANTMLPPAVIAEIAGFCGDQQQNEFLRRFTAYEACLKAHGVGFSGRTKIAYTENQQVFSLPEIPGYTGSVCEIIGKN